MEVNLNHPITSVPPEADHGLRQEAQANDTGGTSVPPEADLGLRQEAHANNTGRFKCIAVKLKFTTMFNVILKLQLCVFLVIKF